MDIKLDLPTYDLIVEGGDLPILSGPESVRQHLLIRLQFFLGEWFLDQRIGVPYFQQILGQKPLENVVMSIIRNTILTTSGIGSITRLTVDYDGFSRGLGVEFQALLTTGEPLIFEEELIL